MRGRSEYILLAVLLSLTAGGILCSTIIRHRPDPRPHIRGVIELGAAADTSRGLLVGYNHFLLNKFAEDNGSRIDVKLVRRGEPSFLDSLKSGAIDILAVPFDKAGEYSDSVLVSVPFDSAFVWLTAHHDGLWMKSVNSWIENWLASGECVRQRDLFLEGGNPFGKGVRDHISPYDSLMRRQADTLGWDWRFLCAVVYQESFFRIEASSPRGAFGLMQVMPSTAKAMGVDDLLDPEQNLSAGSRYLGRLYRRFRHHVPDREERYRFALAAYNAGEGRIDDCIRYARHRGLEPDRWENIVSVIPEMSDSAAVAESGVVCLGTFRGVETVGYVEKVMRVYERFCRICPEK